MGKTLNITICRHNYRHNYTTTYVVKMLFDILSKKETTSKMNKTLYKCRNKIIYFHCFKTINN